MSIQSLCVGDILTVYNIEDSGFGSSVTVSAAGTLEGRIDTNSASEDRQALEPDEVRVLEGFFHREPAGLSIGKYCKWTSSGGVEFIKPRVLRVRGRYHEGRPGSPPMLYVVEFVEMTAIAGDRILP